jgi:hypothetical protein
VEPRRPLVFPKTSRFAPSPIRPPDAVDPPPLSGAWARAHSVCARRLPSSWVVWASSPAAPRPRARAGPKSPPPPGPANRESFPFFLFSFSFPYFLIYVYILIYYAPKIVQIFSRSQNNNTYTLTHLIRQQCLMYCLLPVSARRRGIRPSGRRARARPPGNRSFVSRELRRR